MKIRLYNELDYTEVNKMIMALYFEDSEGESMNSTKIDRTIDALYNNPDKGEILVLESHGEIVGYSIVVFQWSNEYGGDVVNIDELYVKPSFRSMGIGTDFIKYLMEKYQDNLIVLEVTPSNNRAYDYYSLLGFEDVVNKHMILKR